MTHTLRVAGARASLNWENAGVNAYAMGGDAQDTRLWHVTWVRQPACAA